VGFFIFIMSLDLSVDEIDEKSKSFLEAVRYHGGRATTTDIRKRTGLNHNEVSYRFNKLEELEVIEVSYADAGQGRRNPPKIAHLTGKARGLIEQGLLDSNEEEGDDTVVEVSEEEFASLNEKVKRLESRVDTLVQNKDGGSITNVENQEGESVESGEMAERVDVLLNRVDSLESELGAVRSGDSSGSEVEAGSAVVQGLDERLSEVESDVGELEDYVFKWTSFAETYLLALRRVVEEKVGVDMDSYLAMVEESDEEM